MRTLVTGATGFVGSALVRRLLSEPGCTLVAAVRSADAAVPLGVDRRWVAELGPDTDWREGLAGVATVFHLAARVHVMHDLAADPLAAFRRANVEGTLQLARQAADAGVRRFVFVSSIKVNGEQTQPGRPFRADDLPAPCDPYGVSKLEAEQALARLARETGMELVVVRPTLVYGPGVKANFLRMMNWLASGVPLPFGTIENRRSLVALDNLVDLLLACANHREAAGQVFLASDGEDLSTSDLLRRLAHALGRQARLLSVPPALLKAGFSSLGKQELVQRLFGSLQIDLSPTRERLAWTPPVSVDEALQLTAEAYLASRNSR